MKVKYFGDTDTLYIEFRGTEVSETRDLDKNTLIDLNREGQICTITVEHACVRAVSHIFLSNRSPLQIWLKPKLWSPGRRLGTCVRGGPAHVGRQGTKDSQ